MYCPTCGSEERQLSQFCRACGTDLRVVRNSLERPDAITAREQIGMAVADKIRQLNSAKDLERVAEDALDAMSQRALDMNRVVYEARTNELAPGTRQGASITEHTTHHLTTSKP